MKSIKEAMEDAGYEEITSEEVIELNSNQWVKVTDEEVRHFFFKKKEEPKFPKKIGCEVISLEEAKKMQREWKAE